MGESQQDDDIPDWLRGSATISEAEPTSPVDASLSAESDTNITDQGIFSQDVLPSVKQVSLEND